MNTGTNGANSPGDCAPPKETPTGGSNPTAGATHNTSDPAIVDESTAHSKRPDPAHGRGRNMIAVTKEGEPLALTSTKAEARIDSRLLARQLGNQHKATMALIERYADQFKTFGQLPFKKEVGDRAHGGGNPERFALLNEDQAFFLLSLSRNSARVVELKSRLVKAFGEARRAAVQHGTEYLPSYHQLHDEIRAMAAGSANEKFIHMNVNKLVNQVAGIESGQRAAAPLPKQAMLTVAQSLATQAMRSAPDHRAGFQNAKTALLALSAVTVIGGTA